MDLRLMDLRQQVIETSTEFLKAQRVYLEAATLNARKSEAELKAAAEEYRKATDPYDIALQELRKYLLAAEPSEAIAAELKRTERFIETLEKEKQVGSKLVKHHDEMIDNDLRLTGRHAEEEEK